MWSMESLVRSISARDEEPEEDESSIEDDEFSELSINDNEEKPEQQIHKYCEEYYNYSYFKSR